MNHSHPYQTLDLCQAAIDNFFIKQESSRQLPHPRPAAPKDNGNAMRQNDDSNNGAENLAANILAIDHAGDLQKIWLLARLARQQRINNPDQSPMVVVCKEEEDIFMQKELFAFYAPDLSIFLFSPLDDVLAYEQPDLLAARVRTLWCLAARQHMPDIIITCYSAWARRVAPPAFFLDNALPLAVGDKKSLADIFARLLAMGYEKTSEVRARGEVVRHGGIIDIFASLPDVDEEDLPLRFDFFGDDLEGIYPFSPLDQRRSGKKNTKAIILPMTETPQGSAARQVFLNRLRDDYGAMLSSEDVFGAGGTAGADKKNWHGYQPLFFDNMARLSDYLPSRSILFFYGRATTIIEQGLAQQEKQHDDSARLWQDFQRAQAVRNKNNINQPSKSIVLPPLPPAVVFLTAQEWHDSLAGFFQIHEKQFVRGDITTVDLGAAPLDPSWRLLGTPLEHRQQSTDQPHVTEVPEKKSWQELMVEKWHRHKKSLLIVAHNEASLKRWQQIGGVDTPLILLRRDQQAQEQFEKLLASGDKHIMLTTLPLAMGEEWPQLTVITDHDIFGVRFQFARATKSVRKVAMEKLIKDITTLKAGDLIVHVDYGIGQFLGLKPITAGGRVHECVYLLYRGGDKLYLPIENLDLLKRYGDVGEVAPELDKLGSGDWQERVAKTKQRIQELAEQLAAVAAARAITPADPIMISDADYLEFAARFPFDETVDQEQAIAAVRQDLSQPRPMDRLICGDVGFGKTEVALRASFCAVMAGKQVLVITPTTLLARQHYHNFVERFSGKWNMASGDMVADSPPTSGAIKIKQLSRLVSTAEGKHIRHDLATGQVDIVIGTHGLLHKNLAVKNLGLVIVDEEHHFGVKQKERVKQLAQAVHLLTMSATPIPRSLQLSLHGIKDLSLIATPPRGRLAIKTEVQAQEPAALVGIINNELARGGQLFFVAPRINQLAMIQQSLKQLLPQLQLAVATGQMPSEELDRVMTDFADKKYHGLLATNIIESGLDLPNVNTIIIFHGDQFGLAQLYQLRGRVGRGQQQGYCFITYPKGKPLTQGARKRLELLDGLSHLGAGFALASHDLDMRGAGNLLGEEQSGHIKEVGVELYQKMVASAMMKLARDRAGQDTSGAAGKDGAVPKTAEGATSGDGAPVVDWSPTLSLPLGVAIPDDYIPDEAVRLSLYNELSLSVNEKNLAEIEQSLQDRFGPIPPETKNLCQLIGIKQLCQRAGVNFFKASDRTLVVGFHNNQVAHPEKLLAMVQARRGRMIKERVGKEMVEKIIFHVAQPTDEKIIANSKKLLTALAACN